MSKAYDRIEWPFLLAVLKRLGFHDVWIGWVMECVSSVHYSFLINGSPQGSVVPTRGLRQGDPLSPYLFILCTEVLSGFCSMAQRNGSLPGVRVARRSPLINHLLFADDTMFFSKTNVRSCETLLLILKRYGEALGRCINVAKSGITFSAKTPLEIKLRVKQALGIENEGGVGKYLGLPEHFGRRKKDIFTAIVYKVRQRALSWSNRFLSGEGKQVLLKAVLSTIPSYAMSCFKLPISLCKRLQSTLTRFWWDSNPDKKKMAWVDWKKLSLAKEEGGLGFREIATFNDALLSKIGWRLLKNPESLLAEVLLGKYCHSSSFMESAIPASASHGWRGIMESREVLRKGLGWIIGNGESITVWNSPWLSTNEPSQVMGPPPAATQPLLVKDLFLPNTTSWSLEAIRKFVPQYEDVILKLVLSKNPRPDQLCWLPVKSGVFSTKSGYSLSKKVVVATLPEVFSWNPHVWKVATSPKLKMFLWKAARKALPVGEALCARGLTADCCKRCGATESSMHLFFHCPFAKKVWDSAPLVALPDCDASASVKDLLCRAKKGVTLPPVGLSVAPLYPWILWFLWKSRNQLLFEGKAWNERDTLLKAISEARIWQGAKLSQPVRKPIPSPASGGAAHPDAFLCFSDAAWHAATSRSGLGWLIRDPLNVPVLNGSTSRPFVSSVLIAEALALKAAMDAALVLGVSRLACF